MLVHPAVAFAIALLAFVLGLLHSLFASEIRIATRTFFASLVSFNVAPVDGWVLAFWTLAAAWALALYLRLVATASAQTVREKDQDRRVETLRSVIVRAPNPRIVGLYPAHFDKIVTTLEQEPEPHDAAEIAERIRIVLPIIAALAKRFTGHEDGAYGANIMLVESPVDDRDSPYPASLVRRLRFFDHERNRLDSLRALLHLPEALLLPNGPDEAPRHVPLISLPVPHEAETDQGIKRALPGAPWALLTGQQSIFEDTETIVDWCVDFDAGVKRDIVSYFGKEGKDVRSFVSFRLGDELRPVGVLNIDSSQTHVLGREEEFYETFYGLVAPIAWVLAPYVEKYAALQDWRSGAEGSDIRPRG